MPEVAPTTQLGRVDAEIAGEGGGSLVAKVVGEGGGSPAGGLSLLSLASGSPTQLKAARKSQQSWDWVDDNEQMNRAKQKLRFLDMFGLDASQQYSYTITADSLSDVLVKRGLRNMKNSFVEQILQDLARVTPRRTPSVRSDFGSKTTDWSSLLPIRRVVFGGQNRDTGVSFEAFVDAILMPDLPKRVEPRLSRGVEQIQYVLLKQDVEEVINKLSRTRLATTEDLHPSRAARKTQTLWRRKMDNALNVAVGLIVIASIFCLGLSKETNPHWDGWLVLEVMFAATFVADSALRISIHGWGEFWFGPERHLNWLDVMVTTVSVTDVCLSIGTQHLSDGAVFRRFMLLFRVFRLIRLGRLLRLIRSPLVRELSNILMGLVIGSPALLWVSVVIWVVVALVAMSLRIAVGPDPGDVDLVKKCGPGDKPNFTVDTDPDCARHKLYAEEFCGSLPKCMFTVFRCIIGDCTSEAGQSLPAHLSSGFGMKFDIVYLTGMVLMIFGLFNVITARWRIFVEATMDGLKFNDQKQKLRSLYEHDHVKRKLTELVCRIQFVASCLCSGEEASDGPANPSQSSSTLLRSMSSGWGAHLSEDPDSVENIKLTEDQFFAVIQDGAVQRILEQLDIETGGAGNSFLFDIMDANGNGLVDVAEMLDFLMKLRGGPMKVDMVAPSVALRGVQQELRRLASRLEKPAAADSQGASPKASPSR
ncbi:unnamed protein product [Prorocentrum cordatum]|uniref:EF-hand domain-containing protein n=1 Tax=Prorocentrum cordatum TaxID=2364126 RepID=A0ABN9V7N9_9DINO|nr:unnamed protein product [Polarella glacialis]